MDPGVRQDDAYRPSSWIVQQHDVIQNPATSVSVTALYEFHSADPVALSAREA